MLHRAGLRSTKKRGRAGERASPAGKQPRDGPRRSPLLCLPGVPNTGSLAPIHSPALNSIMHRFANASCRRTGRGGSWTPLWTFKTNSYCQRRPATPSASCFSPEPARPIVTIVDRRRRPIDGRNVAPSTAVFTTCRMPEMSTLGLPGLPRGRCGLTAFQASSDGQNKLFAMTIAPSDSNQAQMYNQNQLTV
jgi:hypothetical protein